MDTDDKKDNALLEAALPVTEHSKTAYGHSSQMAEDVTIPLTPQTDDPDTPALTFRSVFIGTIWAVILASLNILFSFRTNPFSVPSGLAQLISYPMGIFFAWSLPRGFFNPGPFSVKEHVLIYVIAASAGGLPYGVDNVVMQYAKPLMADPNVNFWNSLAWVSVTQMIGYGVAGICRRFLVKPSAMLWPVNLPYVALFTALNGINTIGDQTSKYSMSRYGYFWLVFFVMFVWQWLPGFFMSTLGGISLLCLISSSKTARFLGSSSPQTGVGILSFSLDWSNIVNYNPVPNPWWATVNFIVGRVFWMWIVVPMCYYFNVFGSPVLTSKYTYTKDDVNSTTPFGILNSPWIFNRNGKRVYVRRPSLALGAKDTRANYSLLDQHFKLDQAKYEQHSPFYLTDFFAITYLTSFINIATIISHVYLWYGTEIYNQTKAAFTQAKIDDGLTDTHNRLMRAYKDLPEWVYAAWLGGFAVASVIVCLVTPFKMPWWASVMAIVMGIFFTIPSGVVYAVSGTFVGINVITEFVIGLMIPGETVAVICFKSFGFNVMIQAITLLGDLKLGHYMHISPISMVIAQLIGTVIGILFNTGGAFFVLDNMPGLGIFEAGDWAGTSYNTFLSAAGIWGSIGPARFFGIGTPYPTLLLGFVVGLALPVLPWLGNRFYPHRYWHLIYLPVLTSSISPGSQVSYVLPVAVVGFITQFWFFRFSREWFDKYNYVLAIAMDSGMAIATLAMTVMLLYFPTFDVASPLHPVYSPDFYCYTDDFEQ